MQYCQKCGISVRGHKRCCPLCGGPLTGEGKEPVFPIVKRGALTGKSLIRISAFVLIAFEIVMAAAGFLAANAARHALSWIPIVMICAAVAWADLLIAFHLRNNVIKTITVQAYIAMLVDYIVDIRTGFPGWSVIWMIPAAFAGIAVTTIAIGRSVRMQLEDYAVYLLADTIFCLLQIIPIALHQNKFEWPAVICMAGYLILFSAVLLFRHREMKNAAAKYFHV